MKQPVYLPGPGYGFLRAWAFPDLTWFPILKNRMYGFLDWRKRNRWCFFLAVVCDFDGSFSYILFLWVAFVAFVMEWERVSLLSATEFRNLRACFLWPIWRKNGQRVLEIPAEKVWCLGQLHPSYLAGLLMAHQKAHIGLQALLKSRWPICMWPMRKPMYGL